MLRLRPLGEGDWNERTNGTTVSFSALEKWGLPSSFPGCTKRSVCSAAHTFYDHNSRQADPSGKSDHFEPS